MHPIAPLAALSSLGLAAPAGAQFIANVDFGLQDEFVAQHWFDVEVVDELEPVTLCTIEVPVEFDAFSGAAATTFKVELYTRTGSYQGFEGSSSGWDLRKVVLFTPKDAFSPCVLEIPGGFAIQPQSVGAVSIIARDFPEVLTGLGVRAVGAPGGAIFSSPEIRVLAGESSSSGIAFDGADAASAFIGVLHFTIGAAACLPGTPVVQLPPSLFDGPEPGGVGPLTAGTRYVVQPGAFGWAEVPLNKTLTAEPGTQIFFGSTPISADRLNVKGTIDFEGVSLGSVHEGDLDLELGLPDQAPAPGDWEGVRFDFASDGSVWDGGALRYAGNSPALSALTLHQSDATIRRVSVSDNALGGGAAFDASANSFPSVTENLFARNEGIAALGVTMDALPGLRDNFAVDNVLGDYLEIVSGQTLCDAAGPGRITGDVTITPDSYPGDTLVIDGPLCVAPGASLVFEQGVNVKFPPGERGGFTVQADGQLDVFGSGAFPVTFGSTEDDVFGGDTTKNGPSTGTPGDLRGIRYQANSLGSVDHLTLWNGGGTTFPTPSVKLESAAVELSNTRIEGSSQEGIQVVDPWTGTLENVYVNGAAGTAILGDTAPIELRHVTAVNNGGFGLDVVGGPSGGFSGTVESSNLWANALGNYSPDVDASQVSFSNGGFAGLNGNLDTDPLLGPDGAPLEGSPLVDQGEPANPFLEPTLLDLADRGRDGTSGNQLQPDMGALEFSNTGLEAPLLRLGQQLEVTHFYAVPGAQAFVGVGLPGGAFVPGLGVFGVDLGSALILGPFPMGTQDVLQLGGPGDTNLIGLPLAAQSVIFDPSTGELLPTNVVLGSILPPLPV